MNTLTLTPETFMHEIVSSGSSLNKRYAASFDTLWMIGGGFLHERLWHRFKDETREWVAWVPEHCPSAVWLYDHDKISLVIPVEQEAFEYKMRWV